MRISFRHLAILLAVGSTLLLAFGCAQKDDIVQPKLKASITLEPKQLPTLDTLYTYELWVVKVDGAESTYTSLGKFVWDNYWYRLMDTSGNVINGQFEVPEPWLDYDLIMVTVENRPDPHPQTPSGTIMLVDQVVDPVTRPISLKFPADLFLTTGYYFTATPTEKDTLADEEKGLWICSRALTPRTYQDTLGIIRDSLAITEQDTTKKFEPDIIDIDSWVRQDNIMVVIGYDTIRNHTRVQATYRDTIDTNNGYVLYVVYDTTVTSTIYYFNYTGPLENLPDIKPYGWRYNAWAFLEQPSSGTNSGLELKKMAPIGYEGQERFIADTTWGVLPLGGFFRGDSADISNPYNDNREVPQFPGSDFIVNAPPRFANLNFRRPVSHFWGSVAIGMEPDPTKLRIDTTRNFPLIFLADSLRSGLNTREAKRVHTFHNWSQMLPWIDVRVQFHE